MDTLRVEYPGTEGKSKIREYFQRMADGLDNQGIGADDEVFFSDANVAKRVADLADGLAKDVGLCCSCVLVVIWTDSDCRLRRGLAFTVHTLSVSSAMQVIHWTRGRLCSGGETRST